MWNNIQIDKLKNQSVILVSCDSVYFQKFFGVFLTSILTHTDYHVYLHVMNPTNDDVESLKALVAKGWISASTSMCPKDRTYYACHRFMLAPVLFTQYMVNNLLILDVDCFVRKSFEMFNSDLGFYFSEPIRHSNSWEFEGSHILASAVFYSKNALNFMEKVSQLLHQTQNMEWFLDQYILWKVYLENKHKYATYCIESNFLDNEFNDDSIIWTGQGPRKYNNIKYIKKMKEIEGSILGKEISSMINSSRQ